MIGIEGATYTHINSINGQQFAPPIPRITTQTSTICINDCIGQNIAPILQCTTPMSLTIAWLETGKPTSLPHLLQDALHDSSHLYT